MWNRGPSPPREPFLSAGLTFQFMGIPTAQITFVTQSIGQYYLYTFWDWYFDSALGYSVTKQSLLLARASNIVDSSQNAYSFEGVPFNIYVRPFARRYTGTNTGITWQLIT